MLERSRELSIKKIILIISGVTLATLAIAIAFSLVDGSQIPQSTAPVGVADGSTVIAEKIAVEEKNVDTPSVQTKGETPYWYIIATVLLGIIAIVTSITSLLLYLWRIRLSEKQAILVPENLIRATDNHSSAIKANHQYVSQSMDYLGNILKQSSKDLNETNENIQRFQEALKDREQEIARYKTGHDLFIYRRFLLRFLSVYQFIGNAEKQNPGMSEQLANIKVYFADAFEECGVELYTPAVGINLLENNHLFDEATTVVATSDADQDYKVQAITRPGLRSTENEKDIIIKARACIYRYGEK